MLFQVAVEISLLAEAALAHGALEGPLLVMNVPHVALEVAGYAEAALAVLALVGLFAGVSTKVTRQVGRPGEVLAAKLARVAVFDFTSERGRLIRDQTRVWHGLDTNGRMAVERWSGHNVEAA